MKVYKVISLKLNLLINFKTFNAILLTKLSIQNYALIDDISIDFTSGLTTITGETGAGKSIVLGGIGLILGNRATPKMLRNPEKKCIIEGEFQIAQYNLKSFFEQHDIDYYSQTIIRRELLKSGKSRAFVNDTPVKLDVLIQLKKHLIDVHSQHQTLNLNNNSFQLQILDSLSDATEILRQYQSALQAYTFAETELKTFVEKNKEEAKQQDYHLFLFEELKNANFTVGEQEKLENTLEKLNNVEQIQQSLSESHQLISEDEIGFLNLTNKLKSSLRLIESFDERYELLYKRVQSIHIEIDDIESEVESLLEEIYYNPKQLEEYNDRLSLLYNLLKKHQVTDIPSLLAIQEELSEKVSRVLDADYLIAAKEKDVKVKKEKTLKLAKKLNIKRNKVIPHLQKELLRIVKELGMPNAKFEVQLTDTTAFLSNGMNSIEYVFSANKGGELKPIKEVASGGELSRIMLAFKAIIAQKSQLPSIIFDEIDTGVSGEIAIKMANIMKQMSAHMQVISITHLPQIAASSQQQMKVYKNVTNQKTETKIKLLSSKERITEIAEMLGGKNITATAINHAKLLLNIDV